MTKVFIKKKLSSPIKKNIKPFKGRLQNRPYKNLADRILSFVFPNRCVFCDRVMSYSANKLYICEDCAKEQSFSDEISTCKICGCPIPNNEHFCQTCQSHPHNFNRAVSCVTYEGKVRHAILQYKFNHRIDYYSTFAVMMYRRVLPIHKQTPFHLILYAPLSKKSLRERGYNQVELLAKDIAQNLNLPIIKDAFLKIKETPKQSTLHYQERIHNVENAFKLKEDKASFLNKRIILVDDVLTTGATADSLSKHLKRAGAAYILVLTIAATEKDKSQSMAREDIEAITF